MAPARPSITAAARGPVTAVIYCHSGQAAHPRPKPVQEGWVQGPYSRSCASGLAPCQAHTGGRHSSKSTSGILVTLIQAGQPLASSARVGMCTHVQGKHMVSGDHGCL